jgi:hypothetical protein
MDGEDRAAADYRLLIEDAAWSSSSPSRRVVAAADQASACGVGETA